MGSTRTCMNDGRSMWFQDDGGGAEAVVHEETEAEACAGADTGACAHSAWDSGTGRPLSESESGTVAASVSFGACARASCAASSRPSKFDSSLMNPVPCCCSDELFARSRNTSSASNSFPTGLSNTDCDESSMWRNFALRRSPSDRDGKVEVTEAGPAGPVDCCSSRGTPSSSSSRYERLGARRGSVHGRLVC